MSSSRSTTKAKWNNSSTRCLVDCNNWYIYLLSSISPDATILSTTSMTCVMGVTGAWYGRWLDGGASTTWSSGESGDGG